MVRRRVVFNHERLTLAIGNQFSELSGPFFVSGARYRQVPGDRAVGRSCPYVFRLQYRDEGG